MTKLLVGFCYLTYKVFIEQEGVIFADFIKNADLPYW